MNITRDPGYSRDFWKDTILLFVIGETSQRILEDDLISFVGAAAGLHTYETILGGEVTVPSVVAEGEYVSITGRTS